MNLDVPAFQFPKQIIVAATTVYIYFLDSHLLNVGKCTNSNLLSMHFNFSKPVVHGNIGKLQVSDVKVEFQILIRVGLLIRPGNNPK